MPREIYALTQQTIDTVKSAVGAVAVAWRKTERYVYQILAEEKNDPFAVFLSLYKAVLKAGHTTAAWDAELEHERNRCAAVSSSVEIAQRLNQSLRQHHAVVEFAIDAMADGVWDYQELEEVERRAVKAVDAGNLLLQSIKFQRQKFTD